MNGRTYLLIEPIEPIYSLTTNHILPFVSTMKLHTNLLYFNTHVTIIRVSSITNPKSLSILIDVPPEISKNLTELYLDSVSDKLTHIPF